MFGRWTYMIWIGAFMVLPLLAMWPWRHLLRRQGRALALTTAGALLGGWAWDALAVRVGVWFYDPSNITNIWLFGLPLEEWLWITAVTLMFGGLTVILMEQEENK